MNRDRAGGAKATHEETTGTIPCRSVSPEQADVRQGVDVEAALAAALTRATEAGEWSVVATIAEELRARRIASETNDRGGKTAPRDNPDGRPMLVTSKGPRAATVTSIESERRKRSKG